MPASSSNAGGTQRDSWSVERLCGLADARFSDVAGVSGFARWMMRTRPRICPLDWVLQAVPAGSRVLDIGCGRGLLVGLLSATGRAVGGVGVDPSGPAVQTAAAMMSAEGDAWSWRTTARIEDWPDEAFDAVTMVDVMHHLPSAMRRPAVEAAAQRLKPGGVFVYKDMALRPWWSLMMNRLHDAALVREWTTPEPIDRVSGWAQATGLEQIDAKRGRRWWYTHEQRTFRKPGNASGDAG
ncbi:MAG: class I SAM-dependent methyltransferase [Planctomycetota bacterium]